MTNRDDDYERRLSMEGAHWDKEFLGPETNKTYPCFLHESPFFRERLTKRYLDLIFEQVAGAGQILDLGCGKGWLTTMMARARPEARVTGRDVARGCLDFAAGQAKSMGLTNCEFEYFDANTQDLEPGRYDLVIAWGSLHHLPSVDRAVDQIRRSLAPGGKFILFECVDRLGPRAKIAAGLADVLHFLLPTDRGYRRKCAHAWAKVFSGKEEFDWSPFENAGGADWTRAVDRNFRVLYREETMGFLSPFVARIRLPGPLLRITVHALYGLDSLLVRLRVVEAEYRFMILEPMG